MENDLAPDYYLTNFFILLDFVEAHHADLLLPGERAFVQTFRGLSPDAAALYVRLIMRKGPHFRADKLAYAEIGDLAGAAAALTAAGLLAQDLPESPEVLYQLCTRDELLALLRELEGPIAGSRFKKPELVAACAAFHLEGRLVPPFHWWTPLQTEVLVIFRLLFFGNLSQDLTEFVLLDLGLLRYETVSITVEDRLFTSRAMVEDVIGYRILRDQVYLLLEAGEGVAALALAGELPSTHDSPSLMRRRDRILNELGRFFERSKQPTVALECYQRAEAPPARERRARILERMGREQEALALCDAVIAAPLDENELGFARRFRAKVGKKLGLEVTAPRRRSHPTRVLAIEQNPDKRVEEMVLDHLAAEGVEGFYAENTFWLGLFGLTFWDILFKSAPGAFFNHYQRGPKDLFSSLFRQSRARAVAARLEEMTAGTAWADRVLSTYAAKEGIANYLVHWRYLSEAKLRTAVTRLNPKHVAVIFDRLSRDPGEFKTGFPDLITFPQSEAGYELVEVKGPGDQLQENQRRWLAWFADHGVPYGVAKVVWAD